MLFHDANNVYAIKLYLYNTINWLQNNYKIRKCDNLIEENTFMKQLHKQISIYEVEIDVWLF